MGGNIYYLFIRWPGMEIENMAVKTDINTKITQAEVHDFQPLYRTKRQQ